MKVQWYMWLVLALILAPIVQQWIATYYPAESYPIAALIVVVIGGAAKWVELLLRDNQAPDMPDITSGPGASPAADVRPTRNSCRTKIERFFWD